MMTTPAPAAAAPTQVRYPGRAVARTALQLIVGLAAALPILAGASGIPQTTAGLAAALAVSAAITRAMSEPAVELLLAKFAPWLSAAPAPAARHAAPPGVPE